jgi:hypothetical protein
MQVVQDLDAMADALGSAPPEDSFAMRCVEDLQPFWCVPDAEIFPEAHDIPQRNY